MDEAIKVGDKVRTGVYVCGEFRAMWPGIVTGVSSDGTLASVDIGSMHGCAPNVRTEQISHLRKEPCECTCAAKDMPFGRCCKATPNVAVSSGVAASVEETASGSKPSA
jgi:hypothetical protein